MAKELIDRIKENLRKGYDKETLKYALIKQGYPRITVERTIEKAEKEISSESSEKTKEKKKEKPQIRYEIYDQDNKIVKVYDSSNKDSLSLIKKFFDSLRNFFKRQ